MICPRICQFNTDVTTLKAPALWIENQPLYIQPLCFLAADSPLPDPPMASDWIIVIN